MSFLCTYSLAQSGAAEVLDVASNHQAAIAKRHGKWVVVETPDLKQTKMEIKRLNDELEQRVIERTSELRRLSGRLLRFEDEERRRLARELHDSTAQQLAALSMNLSVVSEEGGSLNPRAQRALTESIDLADMSLREIRTVSYLLHPPELDELGLRSALARYTDGFVQRSGIQVELDASSDLGRLPQDMETTIFRIVQECLTNIHRHSGSGTASIRLVRSGSELTMEVRDAGVGIHPDAHPGVGIASMRERLEQLGGRLEIASRPGTTTIKVAIPLSRVDA
jgi:signal transduction histidine kinase